MITGRTSRGFDFAIEEDVMDDIRILRGLIALDKGEMGPLNDVLERLLGKDQDEALMSFLEVQNGGRAKATEYMEQIKEILDVIRTKSNTAKN